MDNAEEIKRSMLATGNFHEKDLDFLTDDYLKDFERSAVSLKLLKPTAAQPHVFQGNHFFVANGNYNWTSGNTPADFACGQAVKFSRHAYVGDRYAVMGNCRQGGGLWYELTMWYQDAIDS